MKTSELKRLLSRKGCYFVKHGTRHDRWYSPITRAEFSVPRHDAQEVGRNTLKAIKEQAGV